MQGRRKNKQGVTVRPHIAWYVIAAALLVAPALVVHAVVTWRTMFGKEVIPPVHAASTSRQGADPSSGGPILVRDR